MEKLNIVALVTVAAISIVLIIIQMFCSSRKNVVFSLILPTVTFICSIFIIIINFKGVSIQTTPQLIFEIVKQFFILNFTTIVLIITAVMTRYFKKKM